MEINKDTGIKSAFNEGVQQIFRLDKLQDRINSFWNLPFVIDKEHGGLYGYQVIFNSISSLYSEVRGKCSKEEREAAEKLEKELDEFLSKELWVESHNSNRIYFPMKTWIELKTKLKTFEREVKNLLEKHDLTAPKGDSPNKAAFK